MIAHTLAVTENPGGLQPSSALGAMEDIMIGDFLLKSAPAPARHPIQAGKSNAYESFIRLHKYQHPIPVAIEALAEQRVVKVTASHRQKSLKRTPLCGLQHSV